MSRAHLRIPLAIPGLSRRGVGVIYLGESLPSLTHRSGTVVDSRDLTRSAIVRFRDGTEAEIPWVDAIVDPDEVSMSIVAGAICRFLDANPKERFSNDEYEAIIKYLRFGWTAVEDYATIAICIKRLHGLDGDHGTTGNNEDECQS